VASDRESDSGPAKGPDGSSIEPLLSEGLSGDEDGDKGEDEEEPGMCDAFCGDETFLGRALNLILFPSNLVRQLTVPLLDEESYDWRYVAATPIFALPFTGVVVF